MDRNQIKNMLAKQFDDKIGTYLRKHADYRVELEKDLIQLKSLYGEDIVNAAVSNNSLAAAMEAVHHSAAGSVTTENQAAANSASIQAPKATKRRRQRSRKVRGALSLSELKPQVVDAVKSLTGKRFTVQTVKEVLKKKKVKFEPQHLYLLLPKYLRGITVVDKQKRKGLAMNVYEVTGDVALVPYTKVAAK